MSKWRTDRSGNLSGSGPPACEKGGRVGPVIASVTRRGQAVVRRPRRPPGSVIRPAAVAVAAVPVPTPGSYVRCQGMVHAGSGCGSARGAGTGFGSHREVVRR